ncbi:MAG: hypothetical protein JSW08_00300 [archaeon]|nr:MAG: hypothetical protein JSW08_00300 [archaeon]
MKRTTLLWIIFAAATLFFILQHARFLGWDFSAYVLNAKYLFSGGFYFEWARAPLVPLLIGFFSKIAFGSYLIAEFIYIVGVSFLFFISAKLFAKKFNINLLIFYTVLLSPFVLMMGLVEGTELLSISLLMLVLCFIKTKKKYSSVLVGIFLGLAFLVRFNASLFIFLILLQWNWKRILTSFGCWFIAVAPWYFFTYLFAGSAFMNAANSFAMNNYFREYISHPFSLGQLFQAASYYYIPLFLIGIVVFIFLLNKKTKKKAEKNYKKDLLYSGIIMLFFLALSLYAYWKSPVKLPRYLFLVCLPLAYFSAIALQSINKKKLLTIIVIIILLFNFAFVFLSLGKFGNNRQTFSSVAETLDKDCMHVSNMWVYMNYYGVVTVYPESTRTEFITEVRKGKRAIIFANPVEPDYLKKPELFKELPIIENNSRFVVLGNESLCMEPYKVDKPYLDRLREKGVTRLTNCQVVMPLFAEFLCKGVTKEKWG